MKTGGDLLHVVSAGFLFQLLDIFIYPSLVRVVAHVDLAAVVCKVGQDDSYEGIY